MTTLTLPKLPSKAKTFLTASLATSSNRPYLTWLYASDGYLHAADGYRLHIVRTGQAEQGRIAMPKSVPSDDEGARLRMWDWIKPHLETPHDMTVNAGVMMHQVKMLLSRVSRSHRYWFEMVFCPDGKAMSIFGEYGNRGVLAIVPMETWCEGVNANIDIRYVPAALRPFDPTQPMQITLPRDLRTPFRFQQGDYNAFIMPMGD